MSAALMLGADCTLRAAPALKSLLLEADATHPLMLDGGSVERIDAAGLQLLAALAMREATSNRQLQWCAASTELLATSQRAGLLQLLALDVFEAPA